MGLHSIVAADAKTCRVTCPLIGGSRCRLEGENEASVTAGDIIAESSAYYKQNNICISCGSVATRFRCCAILNSVFWKSCQWENTENWSIYGEATWQIRWSSSCDSPCRILGNFETGRDTGTQNCERKIFNNLKNGKKLQHRACIFSQRDARANV